MTSINVLSTATIVAPARTRHFIHLQNDSDTDIYLQYDGSPDIVSPVTGFRLAPGAVLCLEERMADCSPRTFNYAINAVHAGTGSKLLRVQEAY